MDRKKIIKGLECHREKILLINNVSCLECPYAEPRPIREWCIHGLMDDIYTLLKEQNEQIKPLEEKTMTNAEIIKGIKCCMLIDYSCDECPYHKYGKTCNTMLYNDVMKFLPPITSDDCNNCKYPNVCENCARAIEDKLRMSKAVKLE